jgi:hypothetical protein
MRARAVALGICLARIAVAAPASGPDPAAAPAEASVVLRYATVTARVTPARVAPGGEGVLEVALVPVEGFAWHEAPFVPSRVDVYPPAGWGAEPAEFELPPAAAEAQSMERGFDVTITAGPSAEGRRKLDLEIRYAVRDLRAGARGGSKVYFEDVRLEVDLPPPELAPATAVGVPDAQRKPGALTMRAAPRPPGEDDAPGGSPVLPAVFFMMASLLVLAGVAMAVKRTRGGHAGRC